MTCVDPEKLLHGIKISSVVPATVTGETAIHELCNMDLAMKLHYLKAVYYYKKEAVEGLDIYAIKKPMFKWLEVYCTVSGRIRRTDSGRPFIKCNDSGVRIVEAQCHVALDEWLDMKDGSLHKQLVSNKVLGPELHFSPLVYLQFTKFKCGGMSVGISWAHVLGDPFIASRFISMWGQHLAGSPLPQSIQLPITNARKPEKPRHVTAKLALGETGRAHRGPLCLAKIRGQRGPKIVTVCRNNYLDKDLAGTLSNDQMISTVEADFHVAKGELSELATLIAAGKKNESKEIEAMVDSDTGLPDLIIYGANLTFINLEGIDLYGLELKGQKPVSVYFAIDGIGDEGVVLVLPEPPQGVTAGDGGDGRKVTVILPENEVLQLREALEKDWCIT
ncbi:protein ECERIFERUM 26-like protein [Cinnamomum micranthum f. kanehirae]|uniref:Protein ECERIFERUM 26-like protein n=1 Tax=Cinnamomum micranthum f. kanehirae TaxID=337451 RepID=A0A3S3NS39_9MAGN|nr:protein ECERIFERUM 26-like protein [Cinnamomum micranthum f. kanehirae]